jgi:hypothetical protein
LIAILIGVGAVAAYDLLRGESALAYRSDRDPAGRPTMGASNRAYGERPVGEASRNVTPNRATSANVPEPQAAVDEWITVRGTVTVVDLNALTVETAEGDEIVLQLGPEHFWTAQGVVLEPGIAVEVTAFDEDGTLTAGEILLTATGERIALRDSDGRPMWAGGPGAGRGAYGEAPAAVEDVPGLADGSQVPQPQAEVTEWITVGGTVTAVELNALIIETADGEMMVVQLGPEHYWTAQGIAFAAGDEVEITGFFEDGTSLNAGAVTLLGTGEVLTLRDGDGRPLWAGGPGLSGNGRDGRQGNS